MIESIMIVSTLALLSLLVLVAHLEDEDLDEEDLD